MVDFAREQQTLAWLEEVQTAVRQPAAPRVPRTLQARYDAASLSEYTQPYWRNADSLSPDEAHDPATRARIRERARFEALENDATLNGIVNQIAIDLIGSGPRPQIKIRTRNGQQTEATRRAAQELERLWRKWSDEIRLATKLLTGRISKAVDGEAFFRKVTNWRLESPVKLDLVPIEADQISTPYPDPSNPNEIDGMRFDEHGNVTHYMQLRYHPGSPYANRLDAEPVPARNMFHWCRPQRPRQHRPVSELAPALPDAALLRDFKIATLEAARTAAKNSAVLETNSPELEDDIMPFSSIPMERDAFTAMPKGYKLSQMKAEHPTTTFKEFYRMIVNTIARCVLMPINVALGNSEEHNYASGRLDRQPYDFGLWVERAQLEREILCPLFIDWLYELALAGHMPEGILIEDVETGWYWDGVGHVDPQKESNARDTDLGNGSTHRRRIAAEDGYDLDAEDEIAAADIGITVQEYRRRLFEKQMQQGQQQPEPGGDEGDDKKPRPRREPSRAGAGAAA